MKVISSTSHKKTKFFTAHSSMNIFLIKIPMKTNICNEDAKFSLNEVWPSKVRGHCRSLLGKKIYTLRP